MKDRRGRGEGKVMQPRPIDLVSSRCPEYGAQTEGRMSEGVSYICMTHS